MPGDYLLDDVRNLWKELRPPLPRIAPDELRREAERLRSRVRRRSAIGSAAALLVVAAFAMFFFDSTNALQRVGAALTVLGAAYILVQLRLRRTRAIPAFGATASIRHYRTELERHRDFHRGRWFWSRLLIFVPGPVIFGLGEALADPNTIPFVWWDIAAIALLSAIGIVLNSGVARRYQTRIDALDAALKEN